MSNSFQIPPMPAKDADVYKAGRLAGRLSKTSEGVEFRYFDSYLNDPSLPPVATTLPKTKENVITSAGAVPPFFAGLLPEGRRLSSLRRRIKVSADDELSLLVAVGDDTVGDVQVVPKDTKPSQPDDRESILIKPAEISFDEFLSEDLPLDGVGLAGVQDKVSGKNISVPVKHKNRETILKLSPAEYPHLVENEAYFLSLAKKAGLDCVDHSVIYDKNGVSGLLVSRFDRVKTDEGWQMLAVEDGCQVLGLWPADKYSPSMEETIPALADLCSARLLAVRKAFEQLTFALLTGNGDLHAKNLSVVNVKGEWFLAPAYDLPSSIFYGDKNLALSMGDKKTDISRRQLIDFANSLGLTSKVAERVIDNLLVATAELEGELKAGALPFDQNRIAQTVSALRYRRKLLAG